VSPALARYVEADAGRPQRQCYWITDSGGRDSVIGSA
jgi:hypothetical protein